MLAVGSGPAQAQSMGYGTMGQPFAAYPNVQYAPMPVAPQAYPYPGGPAVLPPAQGLGYTRFERDSWLADCRARYDGGGREKGGIIGSLIGAIGGGILGHEITKGTRTRRIGGTLLGAGVGGLAGMAIGALIGGSGDDQELDECETYLRNYQGGYLPGPGYGYEAGYQYGGGYGQAYGGYTTVMVQVPVQAAHSYAAPVRRETSEITEEVVEEVVTYPQTTTYVEPAPVVKYVRTAPASPQVSGKTVRYTK